MSPTYLSLSLTLIASLLLSCSSKRKVYDDLGFEVKGRAPGQETSLEQRFASSFDEKRNKDGVPVAHSRKVSPFQKKLDDARRLDNEVERKSFDTGIASGLASKRFDTGDKTAPFNKRFEGSKKSAFTKDQIPDFLKEGKGITQSEHQIERKDSSMQGKIVDGFHGEFATHGSRFSREDQSSYIESRRYNTPAPVIYSKDEYARKTIEETRSLLGRD